MSFEQESQIEKKEKTWSELDFEDKEALAIRTIFRSLNYSGRDDLEKLLGHILHTEHRTLQQNFWRMIANIGEKYYENSQPRYFDARNEDSVKFTKGFKELNKGFSHI